MSESLKEFTIVTIGGITLDSPFILAPLAGYSDLAMRLLCREYGAGLCYTEMISAHGLVHAQEGSARLLASTDADRPLAAQLFGSDSAIMAEATRILQDYPIDIIDINMGCPVRKVIKKGAGAALMKYPVLAARIMEQVVTAARPPVTIKIRAGWSHDRKDAPDFAKMAENCGVAAIAVHGRTWTDGFSGTVDLDVIAAVKQAVAIPVIGNGDIHTHQEGLAMMAATGCDAVMIGRGAMGAPWVFSPDFREPPGPAERFAIARRHIAFMLQYDSPYPLGRLKNHCSRYFKGIPGCSSLRSTIFAVKNFQELALVLDQGISSPSAILGHDHRFVL